MNVGLFFGSFNPIHIGHLIIANHLAQHPDLDQLWFVISPHNPLKEKSSLLKDYHRLALVKIAIEDNPKLRASDIEFHLPQPSYTVKTLAYLKEQYPDYNFSLIMGEDNLMSLPKWYNFEYILKYHRIFVYPRPGHSTVESQLPFEGDFVFCEKVPKMEISSTFIRDAIKEGRDVRYLLRDSVLQYIEEMNFYK